MDDQIVSWCERTGYPKDKQPREYVCPECGCEYPHEFYRNDNGDIVGCDCSLSRIEPWEIEDEL